MAGTKEGGLKAAKTIKRLHGDDFYVKLGHYAGKQSKGGGFASKKIGKDGLTGRQRAALAGANGGANGRQK